MPNSRILIIGPFPPPVHGFSLMTLRLAEYLERTNHVQKFNSTQVGSAGAARIIAQIVNTFRSVHAIYRFKKESGKFVSIGCNGGFGKAFNLLQVATARALGLRITIHHHSYGYIDRRSLLMSILTAICGPNSCHIFLSEHMATAFSRRYRGYVDAHVVPNAVFVPDTPVIEPRPLEGRLTVGLISNLNRAKGLYDFIATAQLARQGGLPIDFALAGPIDSDEDRAAVVAAVTGGILRWDGPLYGSDKAAFLGSLDLFVFPTRYRFEAQPTVIYEAFSAGVPVVCFDRGCIREQVRDCLEVVDQDANFPERTLSICQNLLSLTNEQRHLLFIKARNYYIGDARRGADTLAHLFDQAEDSKS